MTISLIAWEHQQVWFQHSEVSKWCIRVTVVAYVHNIPQDTVDWLPSEFPHFFQLHNLPTWAHNLLHLYEFRIEAHHKQKPGFIKLLCCNGVPWYVFRYTLPSLAGRDFDLLWFYTLVGQPLLHQGPTTREYSSFEYDHPHHFRGYFSRVHSLDWREDLCLHCMCFRNDK